MNRSLLRTLAVCSCLAPVEGAAQATISELDDSGLLGEVVVATEEADAGRLLDLMLEVKSRGLLMFDAPSSCVSPVPTTALLENEVFRGRVNWAYHMQVWSMALEMKHCGCPYELLAPNDFSNQLVGKPMSDLDTTDVGVFRQFWREHRQTVEPAYQDFKTSACGE